jgi:hypothetical protein
MCAMTLQCELGCIVKGVVWALYFIYDLPLLLDKKSTQVLLSGDRTQHRSHTVYLL